MGFVSVNVADLAKADWLALRMKHITSTDAHAIIGDREINPYKTPMDVFLEKTGRRQPDNLDGNSAVKWGILLEDVVAQNFASEHPEWEVTNPQAFFFRTDLDYPMGTSVDRLLRHRETGEKALLEIKTAARSDKWGLPGTAAIPSMYAIQVQHQMGVLEGEYQRTFVAVLVAGRDYNEYVVPRDETLLANMVKIQRDFWKNHIVPDIMPEALTYADAIGAVGEIHKEQRVTATEEMLAWVEELREIRARGKVNDLRETEIKRDLRLAMGKAAILEDANGRKIATFSEVSSNRIDTELLRANYPEIAAVVAKRVTSQTLSLAKAL
ncbi:MAG: YqaJ viral recombinase family nuclease [Vulcanimicrobiaceae bacterium]